MYDGKLGLLWLSYRFRADPDYIGSGYKKSLK